MPVSSALSWSKSSWAELPERIAGAGASALLPVGATEQHGPHLGTGVDALIAERLCAAVGETEGVPVLPALPYGCSIGHSRRWPGTLAVQPITLINFVKEIGDWAYHSGVKRLFIVNAHVTNAAPLRCALEMLRAEHDDMMVALINTGEISDRVRAAHFADAADWHANAAETSLMLALDPDMVREGIIADSDDPDRTEGLVFSHPVNRTSLNGVTGAPSRASAEDGAKLFEAMTQDLCALVRRGTSEEPPLAHSYSSHCV